MIMCVSWIYYFPLACVCFSDFDDDDLPLDDDLIEKVKDGEIALAGIKDKAQSCRSMFAILQTARQAHVMLSASLTALAIPMLESTDTNPFTLEPAHIKHVNIMINQLELLDKGVKRTKLHMHLLYFAKYAGEMLYKTYYSQKGINKLGLTINEDVLKSSVESAGKQVAEIKKEKEKEKEKSNKNKAHTSRGTSNNHRGGGGGGGYYGGGYKHHYGYAGRGGNPYYHNNNNNYYGGAGGHRGGYNSGQASSYHPYQRPNGSNAQQHPSFGFMPTGPKMPWTT